MLNIFSFRKFHLDIRFSRLIFHQFPYILPWLVIQSAITNSIILMIVAIPKIESYSKSFGFIVKITFECTMDGYFFNFYLIFPLIEYLTNGYIFLRHPQNSQKRSDESIDVYRNWFYPRNFYLRKEFIFKLEYKISFPASV